MTRRHTPSFPAPAAVMDEPIQPETAPETPVYPDITRLEAIHDLTGGQDGTVDAKGTFTPETAPAALQMPAEPLVKASSETPEALRAHLEAIDPATLQKLAREHEGAVIELPDGSIKFPAVISEEIVTRVRTWAEGAGMDFSTYMQQTIDTALQSYVLAEG